MNTIRGNGAVTTGQQFPAPLLVLYSQISLAVALLVCVLLMPHFLFSRNMGGVSNYGVHWRTVVPYTAGLLMSAWLLLKASPRLALAGHPPAVVILCRVTGILYLLVLISTYPYKTAPVWGLLHLMFAIVLAIAQLAGAIIVATLLRDRVGYLVLALVGTGFTLMALTSFGALHVLFVAEVLTATGFGVLLVRVVRRAEVPCP